MQTPSPHRFLSGQRKAQSSGKEVRPPSALRSEITRSSFDDDTQSSQFAPTPRFSYGRPKAAIPSRRPSSPDRTSFAHALKANTRYAEDVEDATNEDDEMLELEQDSALGTKERSPTQGVSQVQWTNDLALSPKRRKLQYDDEAVSSQERPELDDPESAASHATTKETSRFTNSLAQWTPYSTTVDGVSTQRPAFIRPPAQPQEPSEPLPEVFSPHRKGKKFVAGGMATTVQRLILETGQAAVQSRRGQWYLHGEDYVVRAEVGEGLEGNRPSAVRGEMQGGVSVDLLLAGSSKDVRKVDPGSVVGVRAPVWQVDVGGKVWTVGVDWRLLP